MCDGPGRIFPALFPVGPFLLRKLLACKPDSEAVVEAVAEAVAECMFKSVMLGSFYILGIAFSNWRTWAQGGQKKRGRKSSYCRVYMIGSNHPICCQALQRC